MPRIPLRTEPYSSPTHQRRHFRSKRDLLLKSLSKSSFINGSEFFVLFITAHGDVETYASELLGARKEEIWREDVVEGLRSQVVREGERRRAALIEAGKGGRVKDKGGPLEVLMSAKKAKKEQRARDAEEGGVKKEGPDIGDSASKTPRTDGMNDSDDEDDEHRDPERTMVEHGDDSASEDENDIDAGDFIPFGQGQSSAALSALSKSNSKSTDGTPTLTSVEDFLPSQLPAPVPVTTPAMVRRRSVVDSAFKTPGKFAGTYSGGAVETPSRVGAGSSQSYNPSMSSHFGSAQSHVSFSQVAPAHTLRLPFTRKATNQFYIARFVLLQQASCKLVVKTWIKVLEPKKQTKYPYNSGEEGRPPWWPVEVRHREPDHLLKGERVDLLVAILRCPLIASSRLELATAEVSTHIQAGKMKILREIYRVRREEEKREAEIEALEREGKGSGEDLGDLVVPLPGSPVAMPTPGVDLYTIASSSPFPPDAPEHTVFSAQPTPISQMKNAPTGQSHWSTQAPRTANQYFSEGSVHHPQPGNGFLGQTVGSNPPSNADHERKRKSDALGEGNKANVVQIQTPVMGHKRTPTLSQVAERLEGANHGGAARKRARADSNLSAAGYPAQLGGPMSTPLRQQGVAMSPRFAASPLARNGGGGWGGGANARMGMSSPQQGNGAGFTRPTMGHLRGPSQGQSQGQASNAQPIMETTGMPLMVSQGHQGSPLPPGYQTADHYPHAGSPWATQNYPSPHMNGGNSIEKQRHSSSGMLSVNDPNAMQASMGRVRSSSTGTNAGAGPSRMGEMTMPLQGQDMGMGSPYVVAPASGGYYLPAPPTSQAGFIQAPYFPIDTSSLENPIIYAPPATATPGTHYDPYSMASGYYDGFNEPAAATEGFRYLQSAESGEAAEERSGFNWGEASG